jgi:hypothetical protein
MAFPAPCPKLSKPKRTGNNNLQHVGEVRAACAAWIVHIVRLLLRTVGVETSTDYVSLTEMS